MIFPQNCVDILARNLPKSTRFLSFGENHLDLDCTKICRLDFTICLCYGFVIGTKKFIDAEITFLCIKLFVIIHASCLSDLAEKIAKYYRIVSLTLFDNIFVQIVNFLN